MLLTTHTDAILVTVARNKMIPHLVSNSSALPNSNKLSNSSRWWQTGA